jgi:hypothetical protein
MKLIGQSPVDALTVFDDCSSGMYRPRKSRLDAARPSVAAVNQAYLIASSLGTAFAFLPAPSADPYFQSDMKFLYESKFRDERLSGKLFDELILLAAGDCPYCGLDTPRTLDHCLPKSSYPHLSVSPLNLVPSCTDCNILKSDTVGASINAYSDTWAGTVPWLLAQMDDPTAPGLLKFSAKMPPGWPPAYQVAVENAFESNSLKQRYHDRAKIRWNTYESMYRSIASKHGIEAIRDHLSLEADANATQRLNGWEAAAYRCWANGAARIFW